MKWLAVCNDPLVRGLPYEIELNECGKIGVSPASNRRGSLQAALARALTHSRDDGLVIAECSVQTTNGVKVADVPWASAEFMDSQGDITLYVRAPDTCFEILSAPDAAAEMEEKRRLNFAMGEREVWFCTEQGDLFFFDENAASPTSALFPIVVRVDTDLRH